MKNTTINLFYLVLVLLSISAILLAWLGSVACIIQLLYFVIILEMYENYVRFEREHCKKSQQLQEEYEKLYRECPTNLRKHIFTKDYYFLT